MIMKKNKKNGQWKFVGKISGTILLMLCLQLVTISCKKKIPGNDPAPTSNVQPSANQLFILTGTVEAKNLDMVSGIIKKDLFAMLLDVTDVKSIETYNVKSTGANRSFVVKIELNAADKKGIELDGNGNLLNIDLSQLFKGDFRSQPAFKNLAQLKDLVKGYELKAYNLDKDLYMNRQVAGIIK